MGGRGSSSATTNAGQRDSLQTLNLTNKRLDAWLNASNPTDEVNTRMNLTGLARYANRRIKIIDSKMWDLGKIMDETAADATGYPMGVPTASKSGYLKYRKAQKEYADLNVQRGEFVRAKAIADSVQAHWEAGGSNKNYRSRSAKKKTFVNSFGEATDRYVTSSTYERAQRRNEKEIQSRMKGFR